MPICDKVDVISTGRLRDHARTRKKPGAIAKGIAKALDWFEGKSPEPGRRRPASESSHLSPNQSRSGPLYIPKYTPVAHPEVSRNPSASREVDRYREADGYQIRAPPPGSYQDDDTGPSPKNLLMAVTGVKSAVTHFAKVLIADMSKHPAELEPLQLTIRREVKAPVERANHWKFVVQAYVCNRLFEGFDAPNGYFGIEHFANDRMTSVISFADFSKFKDKAATISDLFATGSEDRSFLGRFCFKKFKAISGEHANNQPLPIYEKEWSAVESERHPNSKFYQSFLKVAVSVWLLHRLVHSFEQKVEMLTYDKGAKFERRNMESVVPGGYEEEDEENDVNTEVGFSVIPGFQVSRSVVKCDVYLRNKTRSHTDDKITETTVERISIDKTPLVKISTPGKTTPSNWTPPVTPGSDVQSSASVQTTPGSDTGRGSNYKQQRRSSTLAEKDAAAFRESQQRSGGNNNNNNHHETGSRTRRKSRSSEHVRSPAEKSHDRDTAVYRMPAPNKSRGPPNAAAPTYVNNNPWKH